MELLNFIILVIFFNNSSSFILQNNNLTNFKYQALKRTLIDKSSAKSVSQAISDIIREFYIVNNIKFEFIIYGEKSNHINDVINGIKNENIPSTLKHIQDIENWNHQMENSAIIFVKHRKDFKNLQLSCTEDARGKTNPQLTNKVYKVFKFMIYVEEIIFYELQREYIDELPANVFFPADLRYYEFFLPVNHENIELSAYQLYSSAHCGFFKPILLNSFDMSLQKWVNKLEKFDHYKNFHGCILQILAKYDNTLYMEGTSENEKKNLNISKLVFDKNTKFGELVNEIMQLMAKRNNFSFHYTILTSYHERKTIFGTRNIRAYEIYTIPLQNIMVHRYSIRGDFALPHNYMEHFYLLSLNDLYTNYEKLSMPFDFATWIFLMFT